MDARLPKEHELKVWPSYFQEIHSGRKTFEVRLNDRDFRMLDTLRLREFDPAFRGEMGERGRFTGRECKRLVGYMMHSGDPAIVDMEAAHAGIAHGFVVMSLCTSHEDNARKLAASAAAFAKRQEETGQPRGKAGRGPGSES